MAEILIRNIDNCSGVPGDCHRYRRGDLIVIMDDGHSWGSKETVPDFVKVRITNADAADIQDLLEQEIDELDNNKLKNRRKLRLPIENLPPGDQSTLEAGDFVEFNEAQFRARLQGNN